MGVLEIQGLTLQHVYYFHRSDGREELLTRLSVIFSVVALPCVLARKLFNELRKFYSSEAVFTPILPKSGSLISNVSFEDLFNKLVGLSEL